jgi:hypothetical protein
LLAGKTDIETTLCKVTLGMLFELGVFFKRAKRRFGTQSSGLLIHVGLSSMA